MNQSHEDFLIEIGTEELPPKALSQLASSLADKITQELTKANVPFSQVNFFATPRRLAVLVEKVAERQCDQVIEKIGPAKSVAYDQNNKPTAAAVGFAKSCNVSLEKLKLKETPKGECLYFCQKLPGEAFIELIPALIKNAIIQLPTSKPMLWGEQPLAFIRPVRWLLMIYGNSVVPCNLFDLNSNNITYGHRFHSPSPIIINTPKTYATELASRGYVLVNFEQRKEAIRKQIQSLALAKGQAVIDEALLNEVTGLIEWPVAMLGRFDDRFLKVPQEALISSMKLHQKCFPLVNNEGQLLPYFIFVANIESTDPNEVIRGNQRVIHARLADAEFFYHSDLKTGIEKHLNQLKNIIFQNKLGTLYDKAIRISNLSGTIAQKLDFDTLEAKRAGLLCKADLTTEMVGEFPELQGIMGYYYALEDKASPSIALAIKEHYAPKFSGDTVPTTPSAIAVSLADKLDTLLGIFGINQPPTGEKDPFGLRRLALGVLRTIIENQIKLDLRDLLEETLKEYKILENENAVEQTLAFIMERLRAWYTEQGVASDVYASVSARYPTSPLDFEERIKAIQYFQKLPEARALAGANKRVSNILKQTSLPSHSHYNYALFELAAEKNLADKIERETKKIEELCSHFDYKAALTLLASMRTPIDQFFDEVMVMTEDEKLRDNRLILLNNLRQLFLQIADISLLQS